MDVTVYSTTWCGYCRRLVHALSEAGVPATVVDVDETDEYDDRIRAVAGGNRVVPTVDVGGTLLVNPTVDQVRAQLTKHL